MKTRKFEPTGTAANSGGGSEAAPAQAWGIPIGDGQYVRVASSMMHPSSAKSSAEMIYVGY